VRGLSPPIETPHPALRTTFSHKGRREKHAFTFSRHHLPEALKEDLTLPIRGRREDRVRAAPAVLRAVMHKKMRTQAYRFGGNIRPSLRNGFTAYFVLAPVNGLYCHRHPLETFASDGLDASVAASGPHDFAVRIRRARLSRLPRPSQSRPAL